MGEQAGGDMDLTWQEILSITELQGLDMHQDCTYEAGYGYQTPLLPFPGCSFGIFQRDSMVPTTSNNLPPYVDTISSQSQQPPTLPLVSGYGPTSYTGMLISSSISPMEAMSYYPSKLMSGVNTSRPECYTRDSPAQHQVTKPACKGQEDFESDSGLSLNFSDGESMEIEKIDTKRLQSEYMEIISPNAFQHALAPNMTESYMEPNGCQSQTYIGSLTQELVCSRDERRAAAMQIPFPTDRIVNLPVEDFNELLSCYTLTEPQLALVKDIRRRGKNKVAAQNCRKRKMENIAILEIEIGKLRSEREGLRREREEVEKTMGDLKDNFRVLQQEVYTILQNKGSLLDQENLLTVPFPTN